MDLDALAPLPSCSLEMERVSGTPRERERRFSVRGRRWAHDPYILAIAQEIRAASKSIAERRIAALRLVQRLPYRPDPAHFGSDDALRSTCEILGRGGDCNNLSAFLVGLYTALGETAEARWIEQPQETQDHVAVQLLVGTRWQWCEPTLYGAEIGEHPHEASRRLAQRRTL